LANPLFMGAPGPSKKDGIIRVMADHGHEGVLVTIQDTENRSEWPETARGVQPKPVTVANGINKVTGKSMPLVSAYDGAPAGVGRIVAHTTWHHFVNVNLHGFLVPEARDKYLLAGIVAQQQENERKQGHRPRDEDERSFSVPARGILRALQSRLDHLEAEGRAIRDLQHDSL